MTRKVKQRQVRFGVVMVADGKVASHQMYWACAGAGGTNDKVVTLMFLVSFGCT